APAARTRRRRAFGSAPRSGGTRTRRPSSLRSRHTGRWPLLGCYLVRSSAIEAVEVDVERLVASPPPAALVDAAHVVERPEPVEVPEQFPEHAIVGIARKGRDPDQVAVAALEPAGLVVDEQDLPPVEAEPVELADVLEPVALVELEVAPRRAAIARVHEPQPLAVDDPI